MQMIAIRSVTQSLQAPAIPSLILAPVFGSSILLFNGRHRQIGVINVKGGYGLGAVAMDKQGDIYLAHSGRPNTVGEDVDVYAPPYTSQPTVIPTHVGFADGVAIDWKTGVFAVISNCNRPCNKANVLFFRHGSTRPCADVQFRNVVLDIPSTFDAAGTLFLNLISGGTGQQVVSISGECGATTYVSYLPNLPSISDMQFNKSNQLVIDTTFNYNTGIVTYPHPSNGKLGNPISRTILQEIDGAPAVMVTLTSDGKGVWAATFEKRGTALYKFPQGGAPLKILKNIHKEPYGATYPQLTP